MKRRKHTGSAYQRSEGHWEGEIWLGRDEFGKRVRKYATGASSEEVLAKLQLAKEEYFRNSSRPPVPAPSSFLTFEKFVQEYWRTSIEGAVSGRTLDRYILDCTYILPYLGPVPLGEIRPTTVLQVMARMQLAGQTAYQRFKGMKALKRILAWAVRMEFLNKSPADGIPLPRFEKGDIRPLSLEQVEAFMRANLEDRLYGLYVLALDTGARQGELFALEWTDLNLSTGELSITKSLEDRRGILRVKPPKTRGSRRTLIVSDHARQTMVDHRKRMGAEVYHHAHKLIFPNVGGNYLRCSNFHRDYWHPALHRAGLAGFRFHDLRHTTATLLLLGGDNPVSIAARLGHSSPEMLWRVYGHYIPQMRAESARLIEKFWKKPEKIDYGL